MKKKEFNEFLRGGRELGGALRGDKRAIARVDRIEPDSVVAIRARLRLSQSEFADVFGISLDTLQNWARSNGVAPLLSSTGSGEWSFHSYREPENRSLTCNVPTSF